MICKDVAVSFKDIKVILRDVKVILKYMLQGF